MTEHGISSMGMAVIFLLDRHCVVGVPGSGMSLSRMHKTTSVSTTRAYQVLLFAGTRRQQTIESSSPGA